MADVIITVSDPDTGLHTIFETFQFDLDSQSAGLHESNYGSINILPKTKTGFQFEGVDKLKPCSYYRNKFCCTGHHVLPQDLNSWINYMAVKKSAGEKVIRNMATQQQQLAVDILDQKRNHVLLHIGESSRNMQSFVPPKKRITKLKPLVLNRTQTPVKS